MADRIAVFQSEIGYEFKERALLERALTHASHGDGRGRAQSNERLEFLGDRVLGLLAAEYLFATFNNLNEGGLAHRLNAIVNKDACARSARRCKLGDALRLSPAEERRGGRERRSILADACEAVIGALYLDGGLPAARDFFDRYWSEELDALIRRPKDAKSWLQEWAAERGFGPPEYQTVSREGPDHRPVFTVRVALEGLDPSTGEGASKQEAQRAAAEAMLKRERADER